MAHAAQVDAGKLRGGGSAALLGYLQGVTGNVGARRLVGPVGAETVGGDVTAVGGAHHGSIGFQGGCRCGTAQRYGLAGCTAAGNGDGARLGTCCGRLVGHGNGGATGGCTGADGRRGDRVNAVSVGLGQGHVAGQVGTGHGKGLAYSLACGGAETQRTGADSQRRSCGAAAGRLDTDYHLLIYVEVVTAVAEGVQGAPGVAVTTPTEVDVVLVVAAAVTVNVEGVTAGVGTNSAEDDGTSCCHLFLNQRSPLAISIEGGTAAIGTGLLDEARGACVIAEEGEGVADVADTVNTHTATACSTRTIAHMLGLAYIVHQCGNSVALGGGVTAGVTVQHIGPVKRGRRQCRVGITGRTVTGVTDG